MNGEYLQLHKNAISYAKTIILHLYGHEIHYEGLRFSEHYIYFTIYDVEVEDEIIELPISYLGLSLQEIDIQEKTVRCKLEQENGERLRKQIESRIRYLRADLQSLEETLEIRAGELEEKEKQLDSLTKSLV